MSLQEIAQTYIAHVQEGRFLDLIDTLYADDVVSIEPAEMPDAERVATGIQAVRGKSEWFDNNFEVHDFEIKGPWPHGEEKFAVQMTFDMTHKASGHRSAVDEIAVLTVQDGKITQEEFFFGE